MNDGILECWSNGMLLKIQVAQLSQKKLADGSLSVKGVALVSLSGSGL
jgi:hypothetical protein